MDKVCNVLAKLHLFLLNGVNESEGCTDKNVVFLTKMRCLTLSSSRSLCQHANLELASNTELLDDIENLHFDMIGKKLVKSCSSTSLALSIAFFLPMKSYLGGQLSSGRDNNSSVANLLWSLQIVQDG